MSTPFLLKIPRRFYEEMVAHAISELPNECCGLLAGRIDHSQTTTHPLALGTHPSGPVGQVERRYPLVNAVETGLIFSYLCKQPFIVCTNPSPKEFLSDPKSMFAADRDMRLKGIDILAVYHSHPTSNPVPSPTDLNRNYWPKVMTLIVSLKNPQEPQVRGWWLGADNYREAEWTFSGERERSE